MPPEPPTPSPNDRGSARASDPPPGDLVAQVWAQLRRCRDPELPLSLVDLGLIYKVVVDGDRVDVRMTLTSPGCHLGGLIAAQVQARLLELTGVEEVNVEFVWDPPWSVERVSPALREQLNL